MADQRGPERFSLQAIAIGLAEVSTILTILVVAGHPWSGRVLVKITDTHGVHVEDLPVVLLWLFGMLCCWSLWRRGEP